MPTTLPDYTVLEQQLSLAGASISPAELHGIVCSLLCTVGRDGAADWLGDQLRQFDGAAGDVAAAGTMLETLEYGTWEALSGREMQFEPMLPDDESDLVTRTSALSEWCLGFVSGLALGGWNEHERHEDAAEILEIVNDFSAISNAGLDAGDAAEPETAENSYVELTEYVRVGAQFIFETLARADEVPSPPTIH